MDNFNPTCFSWSDCQLNKEGVFVGVSIGGWAVNVFATAVWILLSEEVIEHAETVRIRDGLEKHLNEQAKNSSETVFLYYQIASDINTTAEIVCEFLQPLGGNMTASGGITIHNPKIKEQ